MFNWYNDNTKPNFWGAFSAVSLWIVFGILCFIFGAGGFSCVDLS